MSPSTVYPEANIVFAHVELGVDEHVDAGESAGGTTNVVRGAWVTDQQSWRSDAIRFTSATLPADEATALLQFWAKLGGAPAPEYSPLDLPAFRSPDSK